MFLIITQFNTHCSLRLVAQDVALSRRKHEFESRREHHNIAMVSKLMISYFRDLSPNFLWSPGNSVFFVSLEIVIHCLPVNSKSTFPPYL